MTHEAMKYPLAERFLAPQGEGLFSGVQMAFLRLVGCSVGKGTCTACDTDFDRMRPDLGGGSYTPQELAAWVGNVEHVCLTGGEPLDRDLRALLVGFRGDTMLHVETSGTVKPLWLDGHGDAEVAPGMHHLALESHGARPRMWMAFERLWLTVSPKPGYREDMLDAADEIKVILGGLGDGDGWPTVEDAVRWADMGRLVYVQPRNELLDIHRYNLNEALDVVAKHPQLRLSVQLHKFLRTR